MRIVTFRDSLRGRLKPVDQERSRGGPPRPARRLGGALLASAVVAATVGLSVGPVALAAASPLPKECAEDGYTVTCTYGYTGAEQQFRVPDGVDHVRITAIGGAGGGAVASQAARVQAPLSVASGQSLYVEVGGAGGAPVLQKQWWDTAYYVYYYDGGAGGFNGGAAGGKANPVQGGGKPSYAAGGGGGASDVRLSARGSGADQASLESRAVVAAGGGGGITNTWTTDGGIAGGSADDAAFGAGARPGPSGHGATATVGGAGGQCQWSASDVWSPPGAAGVLGAGGQGGDSNPRSVYAYTAAGAGGGGGVLGGGGGCGAAPGGGGASRTPAGGTVDRSGDPALVTITYEKPYHLVATSGGGQVAHLGEDFADPLVATVTDLDGEPQQEKVRFTVLTANATFDDGETEVDVDADEDSGEATSPTISTSDKAADAGEVRVMATVVRGDADVANGTQAVFTMTLAAPAKIETTSGDGQSARSGQAYAAPMIATVRDRFEGVYAGVPVTFTIDGPGHFPDAATAAPGGTGGSGAGGVKAATVVTDGEGHATSPVLSVDPGIGTAGHIDVTATSPGVAPAATFHQSITAPTPKPTAIAASAGDKQSAEVSKPFATPLAATVTDQLGAPFAGAPVTFTVASGSASFPGATAGTRSATATVTTGSDGRAVAPVLTAGTAAGPVTVQAGTPGVTPTVSWSETVTPKPVVPARIAATGGNSQSAVTGSAFAAPMVVTLTDAANRPAPGAAVTFASTGPASFAAAGGGRTTTVTVTSGGDGRAIAPALTAGADPGLVTVRATTPAVRGGATFTQIVTAAADLGVTLALPGTAAPGAAVTATVTVTNKGPSRAIGVTSGVRVPTGMTITAAPGGTVSASRTTATFAAPVLESGTSVTYTVTLTSTRTTKGAQTVQAGTYSERTADPVTGDNVVTGRITVR